MRQPAGTRQQGFSLIEVIVIVVVAGFLGALLVNMMGTQLTKGSIPTASARQAAQAEAQLESVLAYYTGLVNTDTSATVLDTFKANYTNSTTVAITDTADWQTTGVRVLTVTVTVGDSRLTTLLTRQRTSASDNAVNY